MASPEQVNLVQETFRDMGLEHYTIVDDVEKLFEDQNDVQFIEKQAGGGMSWNRYHRYQSKMLYE